MSERDEQPTEHAGGRRGGPARPRGERLGLPATGPGSLAGAGRRIGAFLLDALLSSLVAGLFTAPQLPRLWSLLAFFCEYTFFSATFGQTPGMAVMRVALVRVDGPGAGAAGRGGAGDGDAGQGVAGQGGMSAEAGPGAVGQPAEAGPGAVGPDAVGQPAKAGPDAVGQPGRVGLGRAALRTLLLVLLVPAVVFDSDGRGLHDRVTGTAVVRLR